MWLSLKAPTTLGSTITVPLTINQCILVEFFVQARLQLIEHGHGRANNLAGEFLVFHAPHNDHGFHG